MYEGCDEVVFDAGWGSEEPWPASGSVLGCRGAFAGVSVEAWELDEELSEGCFNLRADSLSPLVTDDKTVEAAGDFDLLSEVGIFPPVEAAGTLDGALDRPVVGVTVAGDFGRLDG